jgi:hypothetical protein
MTAADNFPSQKLNPDSIGYRIVSRKVKIRTNILSIINPKKFNLGRSKGK